MIAKILNQDWLQRFATPPLAFALRIDAGALNTGGQKHFQITERIFPIGFAYAPRLRVIDKCTDQGRPAFRLLGI